MNVKSFIIELLTINAIASAILVIISKNPVVSVIFLISLVLNAALFLILKGMSFIGIAYILIYLGAIIVLFLFVIMMINVKLSEILDIGYQYTKNIPLALAISSLLIFEFINVLPSYLNNPALPIDNSAILSFLKDIVLLINKISLPLTLDLNNFNIDHYFINTLPLITQNNWPETVLNTYTHIVSVAYALYTYGAFWFLLTGMILLLAMIAPIYISKR